MDVRAMSSCELFVIEIYHFDRLHVRQTSVCRVLSIFNARQTKVRVTRLDYCVRRVYSTRDKLKFVGRSLIISKRQQTKVSRRFHARFLTVRIFWHILRPTQDTLLGHVAILLKASYAQRISILYATSGNRFHSRNSLQGNFGFACQEQLSSA